MRGVRYRLSSALVACSVFKDEDGRNDAAEMLEALDVTGLYHDLEQLEQRLTAIEERMIETLRTAATEETLADIQRPLDADLKPYRGKMSVDQIAMLEKQFLERRLLEAAGLPRLSL